MSSKNAQFKFTLCFSQEKWFNFKIARGFFKITLNSQNLEWFSQSVQIKALLKSLKTQTLVNYTTNNTFFFLLTTTLFQQLFMVKSYFGQMQPNRNKASITFKSVFMLVLLSFTWNSRFKYENYSYLTYTIKYVFYLKHFLS